MKTKKQKTKQKLSLKELSDKLYAGELRDLAHLRGIRMSYPASKKFEYKGKVKL